MEYLTTHDLVWINNILTGRNPRYDYVTLEAAMAGQYLYGASQDPPMQAATLLERLLFSRPFAAGNRRTAFIAALTFLNANGYATQISEEQAADLLLALEHGQTTAAQAVQALAAPAAERLPDDMTLRQLISFECNAHQDSLRRLAEGD